MPKLTREEIKALIHPDKLDRWDLREVALVGALRQLLDEAEGGIALIAAERKRQVESEGWTAEHDDEHERGEMAIAGICYASESVGMKIKGKITTFDPPNCGCREAGCSHVNPFGTTRWRHPWPWEPSWWKPSVDPIRNLVKAGALIAAEIDRLLRKQAKG